MGRREQRAEMQRTWSVYEPRKTGTPFSRKDVEDAETRASAEAAATAVGASPPGAEAETHGGYSVSRNVYLPALARVAVEERRKSPMPK